MAQDLRLNPQRNGSAARIKVVIGGSVVNMKVGSAQPHGRDLDECFMFFAGGLVEFPECKSTDILEGQRFHERL